MLVDRWRALRENVLRIIMLAAASTALLFVLGPTIFMEFIGGLISRLQTSGRLGEITLVNHSIKSGVVLWARQAARAAGPVANGTRESLSSSSSLRACSRASAWSWPRRIAPIGKASMSTFLVMSALCALLIPGISHDYTLPILTGPFAALLLKYEPLIDRADARQWRLLAPIIMCSAAYACLLFSPELQAAVPRAQYANVDGHGHWCHVAVACGEEPSCRHAW